MCSSAFFRLPTYSVLQSVRKGLPPSSLTTSATARAQLGRRKLRLPSSPKWILMATNLLSKSIWSMPARRMRRLSLSTWLSRPWLRRSAK